MIDLSHYISGEQRPGQSDRFADVFNPATGAAEKRVPLASTEEVGQVVEIAKAAWPKWAKTPPLRRARILDKFKALLVERSGSACLNTVRGVSKWIGCGFQAAAGVGVATLMYA